MQIRDRIIRVDINTLKPYEKNNKKHPEEQISLLVQNIDKFGFTNPLLIHNNDKNEKVIIAGHGRYEAAKRLGMKELPCIYINDLSENQIKALRISDNKLTELSETNWDFLKEEYFELKDLNTGIEFLTGWEDKDFDFMNNIEQSNNDESINTDKEVYIICPQCNTKINTKNANKTNNEK